MKGLFLVFFFYIGVYSYGQDPSTVIEIKLLKDGKEISEQTYSDYTILFRKTLTKEDEADSSRYNDMPLLYRDFGHYKKSFLISEYDTYCKQIFELSIIHLSDTMTVRIKMDSVDTTKFDCLWQSYFYFDLPFQKGYFEITDLTRRITNAGIFDEGYSSKSNYLWASLPFGKRKLLINEKYIEYKIYNWEVVNRIDTFKRKQGKWIIFAKDTPQSAKVDNGTYADSSVFSEVHFINGLQNGTAKTYFPDGKVQMITKYTNNKIDSTYTAYFRNGCIQTKQYLKSHIAFGTWEWYDTCNCLGHREMRNGDQVLKSYFYKNCKLIKTATQSSKVVKHMEMSVSEKIPYQIEEGEFINDSLYNGKKYFYDEKNNLIKTESYTEWEVSSSETKSNGIISKNKGIKAGNYKNTSEKCPDIVLKKNGKFYFTKTSNSKKQKGTWVIKNDTLNLFYEYEIYKENKGKKYTNYEYPAYQRIEESKYFFIENETLRLIERDPQNIHKQYGTNRYRYYDCKVFVLEKK